MATPPNYSPNPKFKHLTFPLSVTAAGTTVSFTNQKIYDMAYEAWGFFLSSDLDAQGSTNGRFILQINSNWYVPKSPIDGNGANSRDYENFHINPLPDGFHAIDCETKICKPDAAYVAAEVLKLNLKAQNAKLTEEELSKACADLLGLYPDEKRIVPRAIYLDNSGTFSFTYLDTTPALAFTAYTLFVNFWVAVNG